MTTPDDLLRVEGLSVDFPVSGGLWGRKRAVHAVRDVSFTLSAGETLGVVGESGCGKSTLGRAVLNLIRPTAGRIWWNGSEPAAESLERQRLLRREMTVIFQDPLASLDPRMTIGAQVGEPLDIFEPALPEDEKRRRVAAVLERVGLSADAVGRYPHQFSGGQCQRVGIARALISNPRMIVCDEAVSALDVSIQAQIVALLGDLSREMGVALLFISHNLAVVRQISDRVMVLYLGKVMEIAGRDSLYGAPRHPYTRALLSAVPVPDPDVERNRRRFHLIGDLPSPLDPPKGCVFHTRCPHAVDRCRTEVPDLSGLEGRHHVACHLWRELEFSPSPA
ncbi:ABC transporter ATP-binding protein [Telmatospirillum siberiense]|uniref:Oligopeptide ABC transporter ATP-binding protein OppF n=1 Tax=Telmatospirillum siberiense TaxID=382514 RepID=A0A2N3PPY9_9PROT|nr:oligopeptide/dipeptide ABC transporter ATP-binding protein [Telmatospirillum siberiense]PKU22466.1 oligopeptide ABC transporter ATP-binding protein OppF [Telmatospirillum siberiense]